MTKAQIEFELLKKLTDEVAKLQLKVFTPDLFSAYHSAAEYIENLSKGSAEPVSIHSYKGNKLMKLSDGSFRALLNGLIYESFADSGVTCECCALNEEERNESCPLPCQPDDHFDDLTAFDIECKWKREHEA